MNLRNKIVRASLVIGLLTLPTLQAKDKRIKREQLPPAVEKTVAKQSEGATIRGFSTEIDNHRRVYEVELMANGHAKDVTMDAKGNVIEVEEEVTMESLPPSVKLGLTEAAGVGRIDKIESLTKSGKLVAYEAVVKTGKKRSEVQVGPDGDKLAHPE
jgi:hypothetical protein